MDQRNKMLDLQLEQGGGNFHPDCCIPTGNVIEYMNPSIHPGLSVSGNTAEQGFMFGDYSARNAFYQSHYNASPNFHVVPNFGLTAAASPNFYTPCMFPSSSSRNFSISQDGSDQFPPVISVDEFGRNSYIVDSSRGFGKRKNVEIPSVNQNNVSGSGSVNASSSSSFLSTNSVLPQWEQSHEAGVDLSDSSNFERPEYLDSRSVQTAEGSGRIMWGRSNAISIQPEAAYIPYPNYIIQAHTGHNFHPETNVLTTQYGSENNVGDEGCSSWNYHHPVTYLHGLHSGAFELTNMGVQAFPDASTSGNPAVFFNTTSLPNFHHLSPLQSQIQGSSHQVQIQGPFCQYPLVNSHPVHINPYSRGPSSGSRFPHLPSSTEQGFRPHQIHRAAHDFTRGRLRIMMPEDAGAMDVSGSHGVGNAIDQHQDMRLDIDEMSYEELLALEERIGDVKTGLSEECIIKNLKTSVLNSQTAAPSSDKDKSRFSQEAEACIVCQVEYEEDEIIGTLDCGHNYHGECIKQWLLVKNWCPICKKTAFATDSEG